LEEEEKQNKIFEEEKVKLSRKKKGIKRLGGGGVKKIIRKIYNSYLLQIELNGN